MQIWSLLTDYAHLLKQHLELSILSVNEERIHVHFIVFLVALGQPMRLKLLVFKGAISKPMPEVVSTKLLQPKRGMHVYPMQQRRGELIYLHLPGKRQ